MDSARSVLVLAGTSAADDKAIATALELVANFEGISQYSDFRSLANILVDRVAPWLCSGSAHATSEAERHFDTVFLNGPAHVAFNALVCGLSHSRTHTSELPATQAGPSSEVCARTLVMFTDPRLDGARRLASVLASPSLTSPVSAASLAHLPARIANATLGSSSEAGLVESTYYGVLSSALMFACLRVCQEKPARSPLDETRREDTIVCSFYETSLEGRDSFEELVAVLVGKLVVLRQATLMVDSWISIASESERYGAEQLAFQLGPQRAGESTGSLQEEGAVSVSPEEALCSMISRAPASATAALVRALVTDPPFKENSNRQLHQAGRGQTCFSKSANHGRLRQRALCLLISKSRFALDQLVLQIPFVRPLLPTPRSSLRRIVRSVVDVGAADAGLRTAIQRWANSDFTACHDVALQCQVTRLLLLYMEILRQPNNPQSSLLVDLAGGVCGRLPNSQLAIQRYGMLVGEMTSRLVSDAKPLAFDRKRDSDSDRNGHTGTNSEEDVSDSDLSEIARLEVGDGSSSSGGSREENDEVPDSTLTSPCAQPAVRCLESSSGDDSIIATTRFQKPHVSSSDIILGPSRPSSPQRQPWWCDDDAWSSEDSFAMSMSESDMFVANESSEDQASSPHPRTSPNDGNDNYVGGKVWSTPLLERDYLAVKQHMGAPMSVARILVMLRQLNSGDQKLAVNPELVTSTLRTLCARIERIQNTSDDVPAAWPTLTEAAEDLCLAIFNISPHTFPPSFASGISELRRRALLALAGIDLGRVGSALVENVFAHRDSAYGCRVESVELVCIAMRALAEADDASMASLASGSVPQPRADTIGHVTRRFDRSLQLDEARRVQRGGATRIRRRAPAVAERLFYGIASGLQSLWNSSEEGCGGLAAQALITLGVVVDCAGVACTGRDDMCAALVDAVGAWRVREEAVVRRASALALGAAARAVSKAAARELAGLETSVSTSADLKRSLFGDEGDSGTSSTVEWLRDAANGADGDVYVRQFAAASLRTWATKLVE